MSLASDSQAERFRALVQQLAREEGSRASVGRLLGLNASYVSKIVRGERHSVRESTLRDVARRLGIDVAIFDAMTFDPGDWRSWKTATPAAERPQKPSDAVLALLERANDIDRRARANELPTADESRDLARLFLGLFVVELALQVRDAKSEQEARGLGVVLASQIRMMLDRESVVGEAHERARELAKRRL